jgi:hypothetical protein
MEWSAISIANSRIFFIFASFDEKSNEYREFASAELFWITLDERLGNLPYKLPDGV